MLAARALRAALDPQVTEKSEVLPPPPEPLPADPSPQKQPKDTRSVGGRWTASRLPPPPTVPDAATQEATDVLIKAGCEKVRNGDASGGNKLLMQAVDRRSDWRHFELCMCLGAGFSSQNNHDTALAWFKRAAQLSPHSRDALAGTARAAELAGKQLDALDYYRRLLKVDPKNEAARNYFANNDPGDLLPVGKK